MTTMERLVRAERLHAITQRMGFTLLQLQNLEKSSATLLVLATQATRGMGEEVGKSLLAEAQANTLGRTVCDMKKANLLPDDLRPRFDALVEQRNWLAHRSDSAENILSDDAALRFIERVDAIADEAKTLLGEVYKLVGAQMKRHGFSDDQIAAIDTQVRTAHPLS